MVGLICTEQGFFDHNNDVDSTAEVLQLIAEVGGSTTHNNCEDSYGNNPNVPGWQAGNCYRSQEIRLLDTFDCAQPPSPTGEGKHRLCYCIVPGIFPKSCLSQEQFFFEMGTMSPKKSLPDPSPPK